VRVLLIHNRYRSGSPGGEDVVFEQERQLLESAGHDVAIYSRSNDEVSLRNPVHIGSLIVGMKRSRRTVRDLTKVIRAFRPDIAHIHNLFPLISASAYDPCVAASIPIVQTLHNYRFSCIAANHFRNQAVCLSCTPRNHRMGVQAGCYRNSKVASVLVSSAIEAMWARAVSDSAVDKFIVLSNFAQEWLVSHGVDRSRVVIKPNFVHCNPPAPQLPVKMPSDGYLVFSGRLSEEKGVAVLIEAWRSLRDIPLLVVGDGPLRARLEFEVARDQLPIRFTGNLPRDEAVQIVSSAQGVIVPSLWFEGMPMVVLEAWSVGVPVLASRIGGLEEMLSEDRLGFGFAPGDPQSLVAAVRYLMQNPAAAKDRVERAREVVQQRHSREYSLHLMESVYRDVMARRAA